MRPTHFAAALALAAAALAPAGTANADAPWTPDQVVDLLIGTVDLGAARAICIGTVEECAPPAVPGLDLMINFDLDSADLSPDALATLDVVATALRDDRLEVARFLVEGHTDARGGHDYNMDLSERRAAAVARHLSGLGVASDRILAQGFGLTAPRTDDPFDPENRRVELRLTLD
jgi:outer membrane protein OmpA-like peptidoglycan-associated protein